KLTDEVKAMIGVEGEFVELSWGLVEKEGLRRFTQGIMDPDPRYWDEEFAKTTRYGEVITPHIYVSYMNRMPPWEEDSISRVFVENPVSDGTGAQLSRRGGLPPVPTDLVRNLNAGNESEILQFPSLGDRIYSQGRYSKIVEHMGRDGSPFIVMTTETTFYNQRGDRLCITRGNSIRR
ncbi:MaoC family dehydratase N-terminal domain-containing protein, partial [Chloroflexota bacterium]